VTGVDAAAAGAASETEGLVELGLVAGEGAVREGVERAQAATSRAAAITNHEDFATAPS